MNILVLSEFIEGNIDSNCFRIRYLTAEKMAEKGHNVILVSPSDSFHYKKARINANFIHFKSFGIAPPRFRKGGFSFCDLITKLIISIYYNFDVIYATNAHRPAQFLPCIMSKVFRKTIIVDEVWEWLGRGGYAETRKGLVGKIIGFYDSIFELWLKKYFDLIIAISDTLKKRIKNRNIIVLPGGAEDKNLIAYNLVEARNEVGLDKNAFIVGMSNVISSDHNDNAIFFEAFRRLIKNHNHLYLLISGSDTCYINQIIDEYFLDKRVVSMGWKNYHLYNYYLSSCNIFVLPLKNTNINSGRWPNKIGDYLCLKRQILTNPTGDMVKFIRQYRMGLLCDATHEGFYNMLDLILKNNIALTDHSKDSLYVVNKILSFDVRVDQILNVFIKIKKHCCLL